MVVFSYFLMLKNRKDTRAVIALHDNKLRIKRHGKKCCYQKNGERAPDERKKKARKGNDFVDPVIGFGFCHGVGNFRKAVLLERKRTGIIGGHVSLPFFDPKKGIQLLFKRERPEKTAGVANGEKLGNVAHEKPEP